MPPQPTYTAEPHLEIDGNLASEKLMGDILQISIEESLHLPSMFTIVFNNPAFPGREAQQSEAFPEREDQQTWEHEKLLSIGQLIRIGFTNSTTEAPEFQNQQTNWILWGEITAIETHFTSGSQAPIMIRGYDRSHRLHRGIYNRSFQKMSDSEIVKKIIAEVGLSEEAEVTKKEANKVTVSRAGSIESTPVVHDYVFQENQTNMEFLRERAAQNGYELFVQNGKLHFHRPRKDQALTMKWLEDLTSFRVRVSTAEQVSKVEVRGWNYKNKQPIVATANSKTILTKTQQGNGQKASAVFGSSAQVSVVNQPVESNEEAQKIADALLHELSDEFVQADAQAQGHPSIRPGRVVTLNGMGNYSGQYYITDTHHLFSERVYTTSFSVRGLRGGDLFSLLAPPAQPKPGQSLLIGVVTNNQDPEAMGRVRVKFPTLTDTHESNWARVVAIGAGKNRGFDCLPEIDDEVLVGFEHGDIHRPFIIGGLWNGKDSPPEKAGDSVANSRVRLRTLQTRTGHQLQFVEETKGTSQVGITIKTAGGHKLSFNDTIQTIEIETAGGHKLTFSDPTGTISLNSVANLKVDAKGLITTTAIGSVSTTAAAISSTASGVMDMKAGGTANLTAGGAANITAAGATNLLAGAAAVMTAGTAITLTAGGAIAITAGGAIALTGVNVNITGLVTINGKPLPY